MCWYTAGGLALSMCVIVGVLPGGSRLVSGIHSSRGLTWLLVKFPGLLPGQGGTPADGFHEWEYLLKSSGDPGGCVEHCFLLQG